LRAHLEGLGVFEVSTGNVVDLQVVRERDRAIMRQRSGLGALIGTVILAWRRSFPLVQSQGPTAFSELDPVIQSLTCELATVLSTTESGDIDLDDRKEVLYYLSEIVLGAAWPPPEVGDPA
jgi:hypothetical protein